MKAVLHFGDGTEKTIEHAAGHAITPEGFLIVMNRNKAPIFLGPAGMVGLLYPENDSDIVLGGALVDETGKPVNLKA